MTMQASPSKADHPTTFRSFWHGSPLGPYQLLGLRSFVDFGHRVELFTYDTGIEVPDWIIRRDANEIWPTDHVLIYKNGIGHGSLALHSNLFRYALLHKIGGWWVDNDIVLLRADVPQDEIFFSMESYRPLRATFSAIKLPAGHPALLEGIQKCVSLGEAALFGESGADLFTELVAKYNLLKFGQPMQHSFPIAALEVPDLFDPARRSDLMERCSHSYFLHLFNETWRRAGIPRYLGPPKDSFLDSLLSKHGFPPLLPRMEIDDLRRWTAYLTLHEEFQAGLRTYRLANEALRERIAALEEKRLVLWALNRCVRFARKYALSLRNGYRAKKSRD